MNRFEELLTKTQQLHNTVKRALPDENLNAQTNTNANSEKQRPQRQQPVRRII